MKDMKETDRDAIVSLPLIAHESACTRYLRIIAWLSAISLAEAIALALTVIAR